MAKGNNGALRRGIIVAAWTVGLAGTLAGAAGLINKVWGNTTDIREIQTVQKAIRSDVCEIKGDVKELLKR